MRGGFEEFWNCQGIVGPEILAAIVCGECRVQDIKRPPMRDKGGDTLYFGPLTIITCQYDFVKINKKKY